MPDHSNFIQSVALKDVKCFAFHGYYPEEQLTGIYFLTDIVVEFIPDGDTENLQHTVNYEILNTIILEEMARTQKMLETVIRNIIDRTLAVYPFILSATVGIRKLNPPMPGQVGQSFVQLTYKASSTL